MNSLLFVFIVISVWLFVVKVRFCMLFVWFSKSWCC